MWHMGNTPEQKLGCTGTHWSWKTGEHKDWTGAKIGTMNLEQGLGTQNRDKGLRTGTINWGLQLGMLPIANLLANIANLFTN